MSFTDRDILSYIHVSLSAMSDVLKKHMESQQLYYVDQQPNMSVNMIQNQQLPINTPQLSNQNQQMNVPKTNDKNSNRKQEANFQSMPLL